MGFNIQGSVKQVPPGTLTEMNISGKDATSQLYYWWEPPKVVERLVPLKSQNLSAVIRKQLIRATRKRLMSERPIGCLLSGGLDSSVIASILSPSSYEFTDLFYWFFGRLNRFEGGQKGGPVFRNRS